MQFKPINSQQSLTSLHLFEGIAPECIEPYLQDCTEEIISAGTVLLSPEQHNAELFGLLHGRLVVHLNSLDSIPMAVVEPGECLGEFSLIDGDRPSAYVVAAETSRLLVMPNRIFWHLVDTVPAVNRNLLRIISQRLRHNRRLLFDRERHAALDLMTGLNNRRGLEQNFPRTLNRCVAKSEPVCLIMIDVDHFKQVNDKHGHMVGDSVLIAVAKLLRETVRTVDKLARYGGEEFAIMLPDIELQEAIAVAQRICELVGNTVFNIDEATSSIHVTLSLGVAQWQPYEDLAVLLNKADKALYRAKQRGRNQVCVFCVQPTENNND